MYGLLTHKNRSFGGILGQADRQAFDSMVRDAMMGKSQLHPLPTILNNKFDAVPPTEGLMFDFSFDFKGRGQWKHWADSVKNVGTNVVVDEQPYIPTIESAR